MVHFAGIFVIVFLVCITTTIGVPICWRVVCESAQDGKQNEWILPGEEFNQVRDKVENYLMKQDSGWRISITSFMLSLSIDRETAVRILDTLSNEGVLRKQMQMYCPVCGNTVGTHIGTDSFQPTTLVCGSCGNSSMQPTESADVVYLRS